MLEIKKLDHIVLKNYRLTVSSIHLEFKLNPRVVE